MLPLLRPARLLPILGLMIFASNFGQVHGWFGKLHPHRFHLPDNDLRNSQIAKPLVIWRNDEPRGVIGARFGKHILECLDVVSPILAFLIVRFTDLPLTGWVMQSLLE